MSNTDLIFKIINERIKEAFIANNYDFSHFKITYDIAKLILSLKNEHPVYHDIDYVSLDETMGILESFLKYISPELLDTFLNVLGNGEVHFKSAQDNQEKMQFIKDNYGKISEDIIRQYKLDSKDVKSKLDSVGNLRITLHGTLDDVFLIVHEMLHKIFFQKLGNIDTYDNVNFLVEIASTTIEVMLADYLIDNDIHKTAALKHKYNTIKLLEPFIYRYFMEMALIEVYDKEGVITPESLRKYIMTMDEPYISLVYGEMDKVISYVACDGVNFWYYNRYIIAVFVSYYLKDKFKSDINSMFKLGTNIYGNNLSEALSSCGIDFMSLTNVFLRLLGNDKYKKNDAKIEEIFRAMEEACQNCVNALSDLGIKR